MKFMCRTFFILLTLVPVGFFPGTYAETIAVSSPTLGGWTFTMEGRGVHLFSMPLQKTAVSIGTIGAISSQNANTLVFENEMDPHGSFAAWRLEDGETLIPRYYIVKRGQGEGARIPLVSSGATYLQTALEHSLSVGDVIEVHPYRTLGEVFGVDADAKLDSYAQLSPGFLGDAVFLLKAMDGQASLFVNAVRYAIVEGAWRKWDLSGATTVNDQAQTAVDSREVAALALRQSGGDSPVRLVLLGEPIRPMKPIDFPVVGEGVLEVPVSTPGSAPVALVDFGHDLTSSVSEGDRNDELVIPVEGRGNLLIPAKTFYLLEDGGDGEWREIGGNENDVGSEMLEPGKVYMLRRK